MDAVLLERDNACSLGFSYYACNNTGYNGCCSVDACDYMTCPDPVSSSSISLPLSSASSSPPPSTSSLSSPVSSSSAEATSTAAMTPSPSAALSSISSSVISPTTKPSIYSAEISSSVTSSSTPLATQSTPAYLSSNGSNVPIIAGAVSTFMALSIVSILIWFCLRRRKQKKQRDSIASYRSPTKDYVLDRSFSPADHPPTGGDVFAEFGGRYKSPHPASTTSATRQRTASEDSMRIEFPTDAPLPDIEKPALNPPPVHEHPAYQALPSESPDLPTYQPGQPIHSPPMNQHPAYHLSRLSQHPAFPSGPSTSPRRATFPKRTTKVKRRESSPRAGVRSGSMDITPVVLQLPSGRSELEAEVPASYISPISAPISSPEIRAATEYNPQQFAQQYAQYQNSGPQRSNTQDSRHSMPVGLGVNSSPEHEHHELPTPLPNHAVLCPTKSLISPQSSFHLKTHYRARLPHSTPVSIGNFNELREGRKKEVVRPMSERWSEATCVGTIEMRDMNGVLCGQGEPVSAGESSPGDEFGTWESWARR